ncbi:hypothetical protein NQ318_007654, partial [Aromia moschata]
RCVKKLLRNLYNRLGETGSFPPKSNHSTPKTIPVEEDKILIRVSENPGFITRRSYCLKIYQLVYDLFSFYKIYKPKTRIFLIRFYLPMRRHLLDGEFLIEGTVISGIPRIHMLKCTTRNKRTHVVYARRRATTFCLASTPISGEFTNLAPVGGGKVSLKNAKNLPPLFAALGSSLPPAGKSATDAYIYMNIFLIGGLAVEDLVYQEGVNYLSQDLRIQQAANTFKNNREMLLNIQTIKGAYLKMVVDLSPLITVGKTVSGKQKAQFEMYLKNIHVLHLKCDKNP